MKSTSWQEGMKDIADARDKVWWCTDRHFTDKGGWQAISRKMPKQA